MLLQYLRDSTHALNVSFHIILEILFRHLIRVNCTLYIALDQISQISDILIYPASIVKNIVCMIRKSSTHSPNQVCTEKKVHYGLFYVRSGIEYTKVEFCGEKEDLCFNIRMIIIIFYFTRNETLLYT